MKVVLDTNMFISGIFFSGPPYQILKAWRDNKIQIVISPEILEEYQRVAKTLAEQFPGVDLRPILELLTMKAEVMPSCILPEPVSDDPDDDKFLACALASQSKVIVSGDKHLLKGSGYRNIHVVSPRRFIDNYLSIPKEADLSRMHSLNIPTPSNTYLRDNSLLH